MRNAVLSVGAVAVIVLSAFCGSQIVTDSGSGEPLGGTVGHLTWTIENGFTLSVTGEGSVPSFASAEPPWKEYHDTVEHIVVGEGVTGLGVSAFAGMDHVVSVSLPESLTMIDNSCFEGCSSLESIVIPDGVTSPGRATFRNCTSLRTAEIGSGATYIGQNCFIGCTALESVILGESVASVGDHTFEDCVSLSEIAFNEGLTSIGQYAFQNCTSLESVDLPSGLLEMKGYCFAGSGLTEITIPDSCTEVWRYSFQNCTSLTHVVYPSDILYVGVSCFQNCTSLECIEFGGSEKEIRENAFNGCSSLVHAYLPESVESVGKNAFKNCSSLTEVTLYENVTSVGNYAFQNCYALEEVTFGSTVDTIGEGAFRDCFGLKTIFNASSLDFTVGSTDYGYAARYAEQIIEVTPDTATYVGYDGEIATQTVYLSNGEASFRILPRDPSREGYAFDGWTDGNITFSRYSKAVLPAEELVLSATWASLVIIIEGDGGETVTGIPVDCRFTVTGEGRMEISVVSVTGGEATVEGNVISFVPDGTDSTVTAEIIVRVTNGHASADLTNEVLVDPVLVFTNTSLDGILAGEDL